jgi:hypothetical protein
MRILVKAPWSDSAELPVPRGIDKVMQPAPQTAPLSFAVPPPQEDPVFDRWLKRELGRLHNTVLEEPIPDRLLQIIESASSKN